MNNKPIKALDGENKDINGTVFFSKTPPWKVEIVLDNGISYSAESEDLFDALAKIRIDASHDNLKLLCNGARKDVYPSPMSRSMGGGVAAYCLKKGEHATREHMVNIFEPAESLKIGSVEEQKKHYSEWIKSIKR